MREPAGQTRRLTLTHGLTHTAKRRSRNGLVLVRESVSLISNPKRMGRIEIEPVCERVCVPVSARACGRACACACVEGAETDSRDSQTHAVGPTARPFAPVWPKSRRSPRGRPTAQPPIPSPTLRLARSARVADGSPQPNTGNRYFPALAGRRWPWERQPISTDFLS